MVDIENIINNLKDFFDTQIVECTYNKGFLLLFKVVLLDGEVLTLKANTTTKRVYRKENGIDILIESLYI